MVRKACITLGALLLTAGAALAQGASERMAVVPIECWWRTSASSVRIGELFSVVLTCAVLDTSATTVVPDQSRLDPTVLQLPPFEVTGGTQASDLHTQTRRFFQYEYTLRYIGEDFGRDVSLPTLSVPYRVQSKVDRDSAAIESRDRQYIMPSQLVRILSLVPANTQDIRDRPPDTFRGIEARRFRANVLRIIAIALFGLAAAVLVWALVRAVTHRREKRTTVRLASDGAILREVMRELDEVERQRHVNGWTRNLASRALAALRVAGSYTTTGHVAQSPWSRGVEPGNGRLVVRSWLRPGRAAIVSGSTTATAIERELRRIDTTNGHHSASLAELQPALARMDTAAYGRGGTEKLDLDEALAGGRRGAEMVRRDYRWLVRKLKTLTRRASRAQDATWAP